MFLVGDLVDGQSENSHKSELSFFSNHLFLKSVIDLTASNDLDLQEKVIIEHLCCSFQFSVCRCCISWLKFCSFIRHIYD